MRNSLVMLNKSSRSLYRLTPTVQHLQFQLSSRTVSSDSGSRLPINVGVMFVPQQEAWVVERMGRYHTILEPGLNFLIPILDRIKYVQSLKEIAIDIPQQSAITKDNVVINIDGVLYLRIMDPYKASYGVEDPEFAITQLAQTTMRSEIGKMEMDGLFKERENLNISIVQSINTASEAWGIQCMRYEIRDIKLPEKKSRMLCRCRLKLKEEKELLFFPPKDKKHPKSTLLRDRSRQKSLHLKLKKPN